MAPHTKLRMYNALPAYPGGKRRLNRWIFGTLAQVVPPRRWSQLTFIDGFVGGGAVSLYAKTQGFKQLIVNDWSDRSQLIIEGLLQNQGKRLSKEAVLHLIQPLPEQHGPGFVETHFCPQVFSTRHARALDKMLYWSNQVADPTRQALSKLLCWHLIQEYVCFSSSIGSSNRPYAEVLEGLRHWETLNPKRFWDGSFQKLLQPVWKKLEQKRRDINQGVFTGSPVQGYQLDVYSFLSQVAGDILYVDPPYAASLSYETTHRVLDRLLTGEMNPQLHTSPFTKETEALHLLFERAGHIPIWLLSYSNKALTLDELVSLVQTHAGNDRDVKGFALHYAHMPHVARTRTTQELFVIAYPK